MKKITVPHWTLDNAGSYHAPGSTLTIVADSDESPDASEGYIGAARAQQITDREAARPKAVPAAEPEAPAAD